MRAFAAVNFSKPILIRGKLKGYSDGKECSHVNNEWTCFFQPMSACETTLLSTGKLIQIPDFRLPDEMTIPVNFRSYGLAFW